MGKRVDGARNTSAAQEDILEIHVERMNFTKEQKRDERTTSML